LARARCTYADEVIDGLDELEAAGHARIRLASELADRDLRRVGPSRRTSSTTAR
jgi:hypothetical protein